MDILVIGTGYVGLVTGSCLAEVGHRVICLDINEEKITTLKKGIIPIFEPGLEKLVLKNQKAERLSFSTNYEKSVSESEMILLCVSTPSKEDGSADLSQLYKALESFADAMDSYKIIVIKSTVPPGTAKEAESFLLKALQKRGKSYEFDLLSNPEFLREGCAVTDCMNPDRIIVGLKKESLKPVMHDLYKPFGLKKTSLQFMDPCSSEMTKYAANAMLATRISFMNELSGLCEKMGANIESVREGIGSDLRIGPQFLFAGAGFGGSCFPKDIRALRAKAKQMDYPMPILDAVEEINERQKKLLGKKIKAYFEKRGGIKGKTIAIWGLSFKPNTDDIREAPAIELIKELKHLGANLRVFDPAAMNNAKTLFSADSDFTFCENEYEASEGADAIALLTEWNNFKVTNLEEILSKMNGNALFDGRNQYTSHEMHEKGFNYFGIGIPKSDV